jgi:hypothetical protein
MPGKREMQNADDGKLQMIESRSDANQFEIFAAVRVMKSSRRQAAEVSSGLTNLGASVKSMAPGLARHASHPAIVPVTASRLASSYFDSCGA